MRNSYRLLGALGALLMILPTTLSAQSNSLSAFSPYTFYGLGDMSVQGSAFFVRWEVPVLLTATTST